MKTRTKKKLKYISPEVFSQSFWLLKLINKFMRDGKKARVETAFATAFFLFKSQYLTKAPYFLLFRTFLLYRPLIGFSKKRISRQFKSVPIPLSPHRQMVMVLTWFTHALRTLNRGPLRMRLLRELQLIQTQQKSSLKRYKDVQDLHFSLVMHRVNTRYRWC